MEDYEENFDDLIADAQEHYEDMMEDDALQQMVDEEQMMEPPTQQPQSSPPVPMGQPEPFDEEEEDILDEPASVPETVEAGPAVRLQFARARATPKSDIFKFERYVALWLFL